MKTTSKTQRMSLYTYTEISQVLIIEKIKRNIKFRFPYWKRLKNTERGVRGQGRQKCRMEISYR